MLTEGETYVYGKTTPQARALLAACETLGLPREVVRTTDNGFIVPNAVADQIERAEAPGWADAGATL